MTYQEFITSKELRHAAVGFEPLWMPKGLFDFQSHLVDWSIRRGRGALFEDCGLGKTIQQLTWAENILRKTNKSVLILTPLSVAFQTVKEGKKFGIQVTHCRDGKFKKGLIVSNYERLQYFDPKDFSGVVCDESSILKNFDGSMRQKITDFLLKVDYRLLCTATPSPNDYMELGTSSEALGVMKRNQMLGMFFTNGEDTTQQWMLKGHARTRFWRWVSTWARAIRKPSDLNFKDKGFDLTELKVNHHVVSSGEPEKGFFVMPASTLNAQREERKKTVQTRCEKVAEVLPKNKSCVAWCHLNTEGDLLEQLIPGAVQIQGQDRDEVKEERFEAFASGQIRAIVTKPRIASFGLNWQHCSHMSYFPSHSYEQYYQAIRRCWRFGQKNSVSVEIVASQAESSVITNMRKKELAAERMFEDLIREMSQFQKTIIKDQYNQKTTIPKWLENK